MNVLEQIIVIVQQYALILQEAILVLVNLDILEMESLVQVFFFSFLSSFFFLFSFFFFFCFLKSFLFGIISVDYNECIGENNGNNCSTNANCINIPGEFSCTCHSGFLGDGIDCEGFFSLLFFLLFRCFKFSLILLKIMMNVITLKKIIVIQLLQLVLIHLDLTLVLVKMDIKVQKMDALVLF